MDLSEEARPIGTGLDDLLPRGMGAFAAPVEQLAVRLGRCAARAGVRRVAVVNAGGGAPASVVPYLAALRAGLTPALVRPSWTPPGDYLADRGFGLIVTGEDIEPVAGRTSAADEEDVILFTSGTTARPKGVRLSLGGLLANLVATQSYLQLRDADRIALPLPIHYSYGLSTLHLGLHVGAEVTFLDHGQPPVLWLGDAIRAEPTVLALLPHQVRLLLRVRDFDAVHLTSLHTITVAGGALAPGDSDALQARFPDARVVLMYGQTEAGPRASFVPPDRLATHAHTIGRGIPGHTTLRLTPGTDGDVAELQVASPSLMLGYLDDEDASPIEDDWLSTGDLARMDADGWCTVVGRCAPFFKPLDERVSFAEVIEAAEAVFPGATFRLTTVPHAIRGEALELTAVVDDPAVVLDEPTRRRELLRRLGIARAPIAVHVVARGEGHKL